MVYACGGHVADCTVHARCNRKTDYNGLGGGERAECNRKTDHNGLGGGERAECNRKTDYKWPSGGEGVECFVPSQLLPLIAYV